MSNWKVLNLEGQVHVYPLDEEAEHWLDRNCRCSPKIENRRKRLVIHNEFKEQTHWEFGPTPQERQIRQNIQVRRNIETRRKES